ncbi:acyltransferase family protein [Dactylosporangium maewongense]|uniref:acyltransferase family protein n=1 Tax=Dactylosporangium maewongense TaxID=634393 RepID=UPI0031D882BA
MPTTAPTAAPARSPRLPALDGVRAVALCAVLLVHGMPGLLPGGFLGVDLFFVLSGFLITSLLLREAETTGRISLGGFWLRRARRLLPALLLMVAFVLLTARWLLPAQDPAPLRTDAVAALTYWANWRMADRGGDYFTETAAASPLQHTWSLAIEEQFYLLWPLLLILALRLPRRRLVIGIGALLGAAASAVAAASLPATDGTDGTDRLYFGTDTRACAPLIGCALAAALPVLTRHTTLRRCAAAAGVPVICAGLAAAHGDSPWLFHGGLALFAVAAAAVVGELAAAPSSPAARLLSGRAMVLLGRVSYGAYLWHWPLFAVLDADRTGLTGVRLFAARVTTTLLVAAVSFVLVEQPIRRPGAVAAGRRWLLPLGATATASAATVLALLAGPPAVPPPSNAVAAPPLATVAAPQGTGSAPAGGPVTARPGRRAGPPRVMVIGDSVSWTLGAYWPGDPRFELDNQGVQGCGIAVLPELRYGGDPHTNLPYCATWQYRWGSSVAKAEPDVVVVLLDRWELMDRRLDGRWTHVGEPDYDAYLAGQLRTAIDLAAGRGARVALLTAPYTRRQERPDGGLWPEDTPERVDAWNRLLRATAADHPGHPVVLDLNPVVCPDGKFTWQVGNVRVRSDGLHLTPEGVRSVVAPWLAPRLAALATG